MAQLKYFLPVLLLILFPADLTGQEKVLPEQESAAVRTRISDAAKKITTIESGFIQTKELRVIREKIISRGSFYFKSPGLLRWEYSEPFRYLIIFSNDHIYIRDEDKENKINTQSNKIFRDINNILVGAVNGTLLSDTRNFSCTISDLRDQWKVALIPSNPRIRESLNEIILFFSKTDLTVGKILMKEASGDYTRIEFPGKTLNQNIPDEKFKIP